MPEYKYTATDDAGKKYKGKTEAASEAELQQRIKEKGRYLITAKEVKVSAGSRLKTPMLADFNRQLGSLVGAGVSLIRTLNIMAGEDDLKPRIRNVYTNILKEVQRGVSLADAMENQGETFPPLMVYMYRAAETSGNLEGTAKRMADQYDKEHKLNGKVKGAFTYPKILIVIIILVVIIIMGYVMPQFDELFSAMPSLPVPTRIMFALSDLITQKWWLLALIVGILVIGIKIALKNPKVKLLKDKVIIRAPIVGKLMKTIYTARFARTLSSLYSCGISIVKALQISKNVIGNTYIESQFDDLVVFVRSGNTLSDGLAKVDGFSKKLVSSVRIGEETGSLEELLINMADTFDYDSELAINKLVSYLEPAMLIIMAIIVAFIMISVLLPMYGSFEYIGG